MTAAPDAPAAGQPLTAGQRAPAGPPPPERPAMPAAAVQVKLAPVTHWLVRDRPRLAVVQTGITREILGVCVRKGNTVLRDAINSAQAILEKDGTLAALIKQWLGEGAAAP